MNDNNNTKERLEKKGDSQANPHELLTREALDIALKEDLGSEWNLIDFEIKDFTKKGDNYACLVTSVSCRGVCNEVEKKISYVAKINPLRSLALMDDMLYEMFEREGIFLTDVAVKLNKILSDINYPQINFPECVYYNLKKQQEILLSRDLRPKGFTMFDRKVGMDLDHSKLLVRELAKLHASSHILKRRLQNKSVLDLYPFMYDKWLDTGTESRIMFNEFLKNSLDTSLRMVQQMKAYERQCKWLSTFKNTALDTYCSLVAKCDESMRVICHGDCWNNNILFRHDKEGQPEDIALLDLQLCRFASLALDLNYFFYTSLTGEFRKKYFDQLISVYFGEFENVAKAASIKMPFTEEEVRKEVMDKTLFGIISGLTIMPLVISEADDVPDFNEVSDDKMEEFIKEFNDFLLKEMNTSLIFKSRFLAILDDILEKKVCD